MVFILFLLVTCLLAASVMSPDLYRLNQSIKNAFIRYGRCLLNLSVCLSVSRSVCQSVCLSVCLFVSLSVSQSVCLSVNRSSQSTYQSRRQSYSVTIVIASRRNILTMSGRDKVTFASLGSSFDTLYYPTLSVLLLS